MSTYRREEGPPLPAGVSYEWWWGDRGGRLLIRQHGGVIFSASTDEHTWEPADVVAVLERRVNESASPAGSGRKERTDGQGPGNQGVRDVRGHAVSG